MHRSGEDSLAGLRHARLAANSGATLAVFLLETLEVKQSSDGKV